MDCPLYEKERKFFYDKITNEQNEEGTEFSKHISLCKDEEALYTTLLNPKTHQNTIYVKKYLHKCMNLRLTYLKGDQITASDKRIKANNYDHIF